MNVAQCDSCRTLGALTRSFPPDGWLAIFMVDRKRTDDSWTAAYIGGTPSPLKSAASFCSWKCAAEYCVARALVTEEAPEAP